jgi:hypothetical protein
MRKPAETFRCFLARFADDRHVHAAADHASNVSERHVLVGNPVKEDGTRIEEFGSNPLGIIIFEPNGRFAEILSRSDLPKFASNKRTTGTPEENQAIVRGVYALFGTYTVNEADRTFTWYIIVAHF